MITIKTIAILFFIKMVLQYIDYYTHKKIYSNEKNIYKIDKLINNYIYFDIIVYIVLIISIYVFNVNQAVQKTVLIVFFLCIIMEKLSLYILTTKSLYIDYFHIKKKNMYALISNWYEVFLVLFLLKYIIT